jgi:hypothetical protein
MYVRQIMYPFVLAGANLGMGWLLYHLSEPGLGVLLVVIGIFVILASVGSTLTRHRSDLKAFTGE